MPKQAIYYMGRVKKINLTNEKFLHAFSSPSKVKARDYLWTFINHKVFKEKNEISFVYAELAKYVPRGEVEQVDEKQHESRNVNVDHQLIESSPFVYIPEYSGIAYQHIWNKIEQKAFIRNFSKIISETFGEFFVDCQIEPIAEYLQFVRKLKTIKRISKLDASVHPPNPLFGRLWDSLRKYLKERELQDLSLKEQASRDGRIKSNLLEILKGITEEKPAQELLPSPEIAIGDAVILMAADGYGKAKVEGFDGRRTIVIRTSDLVKNFKFDTEPDPQQLYEIAKGLFKEISKQRYMKHGKNPHS
jgi:hypothetical protein